MTFFFFFFLHLSGNFSLQIEVKFSQGTCVVTSGSCQGLAGRCCHMGTHLSLMLRVQSHPPEGVWVHAADPRESCLVSHSWERALFFFIRASMLLYQSILFFLTRASGQGESSFSSCRLLHQWGFNFLFPWDVGVSPRFSSYLLLDSPPWTGPQFTSCSFVTVGVGGLRGW